MGGVSAKAATYRATAGGGTAGGRISVVEEGGGKVACVGSPPAGTATVFGAPLGPVPGMAGVAPGTGVGRALAGTPSWAATT